MADWLTKKIEDGRIKEAVSIYVEEENATKESVKEKIIKRFKLTEKAAEEYVAPAFA